MIFPHTPETSEQITEKMRAEEDDLINNFNVEKAKLCHEYHKTIPGYLPTPLREAFKM